MKMIDLRDGVYVDASLIFQVVATDSGVIVHFGRDLLNCKREHIACESKGAAIELAAKIVADVEAATAPVQLSAFVGSATGGQPEKYPSTKQGKRP